VYTEVVLVLACRSIGVAEWTRASTSAIATRTLTLSREPLRNGELVEVLRGVVINRAPKEISEVANGAACFTRRTLNAAQLLIASGRNSGSSPRLIIAW